MYLKLSFMILSGRLRHNSIENHRLKRSEGEGLYLNTSIEFVIRRDLTEFLDLLESMFIEIQVDAFQSIKMP